MEDLAVFTALNHSGSFGKNLVKFKKNKYVIYRLRVGPYGENCDLSLENAALGLRPRAVFSRPRSHFFTIRTSQPANNIYKLHSTQFNYHYISYMRARRYGISIRVLNSIAHE